MAQKLEKGDWNDEQTNEKCLEKDKEIENCWDKGKRGK